MAFADIADNELVYLIRANNDVAREYLIERYKKRIYGIINGLSNKLGVNDLDYEDSYQDCFMVFLKCLDLYDLDFSFYHYLYGAIVRDFKRKFKQQKQSNDYLTLSKCNDNDFDVLDIVSEEDTSYNEFVVNEYVVSNFSKLEQEIIGYKVQGYDALEIARLMGLSVKAIYKYISKIKKIMLNNAI